MSDNTPQEHVDFAKLVADARRSEAEYLSLPKGDERRVAMLLAKSLNKKIGEQLKKWGFEE